MPTERRLRGQEVSVRITRNGVLESTITAIRDFSVSFDLEVITEGYLGETENRFDDIINGCSGSFSVALEGPELLRFVTFLSERAQRRQDANIAVNITTRLSLPDGRTPRVQIKDVKFDAVPINVGGRNQYVASSFSFKGPVPKVIET